MFSKTKQSTFLTEIIGIFFLVLLSSFNKSAPLADKYDGTTSDWPMWRFDAGRTAASPHELSSELQLHWVRSLPRPASAWPLQEDDGDKLAFDSSYEPVAYGGVLFVPSMVSDKLTAYDMLSGEELWRFYSEGPVRFAPAVDNGNVYFVSDDGFLYCLDSDSGELRWKHKGLKMNRIILGNNRLINSWPARGGPVVEDGAVYYASGIWPFMGVFIYALDAESGKVIWENSSSGSAFVSQIHSGGAFGGAAPQGYLAVSDDVLLVPNGRARPGGYKKNTGELIYMDIASRPFGRGWPGQGGYSVMAKNGFFHVSGETMRLSDGKFKNQVQTPSLEVVQSGREMELARWPLVDIAVANNEGIIGVAENQLTAYAHQPLNEMQISEPCGRGRTAEHYPFQKLWSRPLESEVEKIFIQAGSTLYGSSPHGEIIAIDLTAANYSPVKHIGNVEGKVWNMLAASGRLVVITLEGKVYCFGPDERKIVDYEEPDYLITNTPSRDGKLTGQGESVLHQSPSKGGYAVLSGQGSRKFLKELLHQSDMHIIVLDPDEYAVDKLRRRFDNEGIYGKKVTVIKGDISSVNLPPYIADIIVSGDIAGLGEAEFFTKSLYNTLRPYGGTAWLNLDADNRELLFKWVEDGKLENAAVRREGEMTVLIREGSLPGSGDWTHQNADIANTVVSRDDLIRPPLGLLWFGGPSNESVLPRHGRGPIPQVSGGRLFILGPHSLGARDVYTGRLLWEKSLPDIGLPYDDTSHQPGADHVGSPYVSMEDAVYVFHKNVCLRLDPATGKTVSEFSLPSADGKGDSSWGYVGIWEDLLIAGLEPQYFDDGRPGKDNWNATSSGRLAVIDRHDGSLKWFRDAVYGFRHNAIIAGNGRLYVMDRLSDGVLDPLRRRGIELPEPLLLALDINSGNLLWKRTEGLFGSWLGYSTEHDILLQSGRPATNHRQRIKDEVNNLLASYNGSDGSVLWERNVDYTNPCMIHNNKIIVHGKAFNLLSGEDYMRKHFLTDEQVNFDYFASSNCAQIIASSHLIAFRRGAASYFDLTGDGGTVNLGGFRAGCTPNLVPANGVLSAPDYSRTCICSYQMQTSLALIHMPELEYWAINSFQESREPLKKAGINFGAPGDRRSPDGTMWLVYPDIGRLGGTSAEVPLFQGGASGMTSREHITVKVTPGHPDWIRFHKHSLLIPEDENSWIYASGLSGAEKITLTLNPEPDGDTKLYDVKLYFAEPGDADPGERIFNISLQGIKQTQNLDVSSETGGDYIGLVREFIDVPVKDDLVITLTVADESQYPAVISGIEVISR